MQTAVKTILDRVILTRDQADRMLTPGNQVHVFDTGRGGMIIGCDLDREEILNADILELAGNNAVAIGHGVALCRGGQWFFAATIPPAPLTSPHSPAKSQRKS